MSLTDQAGPGRRNDGLETEDGGISVQPTDESKREWDALVAEFGLVEACHLDSLGSGRSSSTSSVSSQPAKRSGTSSRSLRGLANSTLVAYLPALRASALVQNLTRLSLDSDAGDGPGTST